MSPAYHCDEEVSNDTPDESAAHDSESESTDNGEEETIDIIDSDVDETFMEIPLSSATSIAQPSPACVDVGGHQMESL